jgi:hypothetical protein
LPVATSQNPFFDLIGTPSTAKRHFVYEAGHIPPRNLRIKETLDWLDKYLGRVRTR